jgi:hypothetical protein
MPAPAIQPSRSEPGPALVNTGGAQGNSASSLSLPPRVYLRKEEIGPWLGVSDSVIEDWMRQRVIPVVKVNRVRLFNVIAVQQALERFTAKAVGDFEKA